MPNNANEGGAAPTSNAEGNPLQVNEQNAALAQLGADIAEAADESKAIMPVGPFLGEGLPPFNTLMNLAGA